MHCGTPMQGQFLTLLHLKGFKDTSLEDKARKEILNERHSAHRGSMGQ